MTALNFTPARLALLRAIAAGEVRECYQGTPGEPWFIGHTAEGGGRQQSLDDKRWALHGLLAEGDDKDERWCPAIVLTDAGRAVLAEAEARA